ncbi:Vps16, N-terminal region-domain-containing protein [Myxozyma melibiosi]|uniref:Vps16, N-terminal region-domain-containing protein n=1 Tax=Myxozyma melibiosi TaxID=54550 RepID=A0ABR1F9I8_9ASCO
MVPNPTTGWERLQDVFYRKRAEYSMMWIDDVDLSEFIVVGAPYGGAIALVRDTSRPMAYRGPEGRQKMILIYSNSGQLISNIPWDKGTIRGVGWTDEEQLLIVIEDGTVRVYNDFYGGFTQFSLGKEAEDHTVSDCKFWGSGFVARLGNGRFVSVARLDEPRPRMLADLSTTALEIHGWALMSPLQTLSRHIEVLVGFNKTVSVIDSIESQDRMLEEGPFSHIAVSPNGALLALYTTYGKVYVISSDFQKKYSEYDTGTLDSPLQVVWCANDSVAVAWESEIRLVGPGGGSLSFYYESRIALIPEPDGIRIVSAERCEFLTRVPEVVVDMFRIGSTAPSAILLDAVEQLEFKSPKADDNIQLIRSSLTEAVDSCIKAASYEPEPYWQKRLLKAALLGKSVLELYSSDEYVEMCEILRVLNAVRYYEAGILISYEQFIRLTPERLIDRLLNRQRFLLALRLSSYLRLPVDKVYVRWACNKVKSSTDDDAAICKTIVNRLKPIPSVSYDEIARTAYDEGRTKLATLLLNHEPRAGRQVPLLLDMEEDEIALVKAVESGDPDLIYYVLLHLKGKYSLAQFFRLVNDKPVASAVVEQLARDDGPELLKDFYYQDDRRADSALVIYRESLLLDDIQDREDKIKLGMKIFQDSKDSYSDAKAMEEHAKLYDWQVTFEKDYKQMFIGLTVAETIKKLFKIGQSSKASKMKSEFKVPEKMFVFLKEGTYPVAKKS